MKYEHIIRKMVKKWCPNSDEKVIMSEILDRWDNKLSFSENRHLIDEILKAHNPNYRIEEQAKIQKEQEKEYQAEQMRNFLKQAREQFRESIQNIDTKGIMPQFRDYEYNLEVLLNSSERHFLIGYGKAGTGKTARTLAFLNKKNLEMGKDWVLINGHLTPLEFYHILYEHRNRIIVFDDILNMFENDIICGLLLSATYSPNNVRMVSYNTTSEKLKVPSSFSFEGKIIVLCNDLPKDINKALLSRALQYIFIFSYEDMIKFMYLVGEQKGYPKVVVDFIRDNTTFYHNLNIRVLENIANYHRFCGQEWERLAINELDKNCNKDLALVYTLLERYGKVQDACKEFIEMSGRSRATFFRLKKKIENVMSVSNNTTNDIYSQR
jgi:hypothetical protein